MPLRRWHADAAWLGDELAYDVLLEADGERLTRVVAGVAPPVDAVRLPGLVLPGLANAHSHAFHRALRGRTDAGSGDFWSWRRQMYDLAGRLDPDSYRRLARAVYAEMVLAGVTAVGEFHYLHHDVGGRGYAEANVMGQALATAAAEAGLRLTLIDTCYLRGGFDRPLEGPQLRFGDGDADRWVERVSSLTLGGHARVGAGIHSVRAVADRDLDTVRAWARDRGAPLHVHLSEQPGENDACQAATGRTPAQLLADHAVLGPQTTVVHATHVTAGDIALVGGARTSTCLCPTTERSLADGIGPAAALRTAGSPLCVGSDSHAVVDLFEEARAVELDERLATGRRGHHHPETLLDAATAGGMAALGWEAGRLTPGRYADLVAVDLGSVRLAGIPVANAAAAVVFAATAADVTHVVNAGRAVVVDGVHQTVGDVGAALEQSVRAVLPD